METQDNARPSNRLTFIVGIYASVAAIILGRKFLVPEYKMPRYEFNKQEVEKSFARHLSK